MSGRENSSVMTRRSATNQRHGAGPRGTTTLLIRHTGVREYSSTAYKHRAGKSSVIESSGLDTVRASYTHGEILSDIRERNTRNRQLSVGNEGVVIYTEYIIVGIMTIIRASRTDDQQVGCVFLSYAGDPLLIYSWLLLLKLGTSPLLEWEYVLYRYSGRVSICIKGNC